MKKTSARPADEIETILTTYGDMLFRICLVMLGNSSDAEDAIQETMLTYLQKAPVFRDAEHQKAWLLRTTINECKMYLRYYWNSKRVEFPGEWEFADYDIVQDHTLLDSVLSLPRKYREAIHLYYYEELTIKEIAVILEKKESTIKTYLRRGKQLLKRNLEKSGYERR